MDQHNKPDALPLLILGGYGAVGKHLSRLLLQQTPVDLVIAGRRKEKADEFAAQLQAEFPDRSITSCYVDAADRQSLEEAFQGVRMVIVASTTPEYVKQIGQAALSTGCDYLDILASSNTVQELGTLFPEIVEQKRIFITQGGFHPGLPAVFIRYAAQFFDRYDKANVAMAMNVQEVRAEQTVEIVQMIADFDTEIFKDGCWRKATYKDFLTADMGSRFGRMKLYPLHLEEIKSMPERYPLRETGVYVSGFNWFVDNLVIPLIMIAYRIKKGLGTKFLCRLFAWGVNSFSSPYPGVVLINQAQGLKNGNVLEVRLKAEHDDGYLLTAIPVVACIQQYLDGALLSGLWMMGHVVDDKRLIKDMEKMGVKFQTQLSTIGNPKHPTGS